MGFKRKTLQEYLEKIPEEYIFNHNWTLIRASHDQFHYSTKIVNKVKIDSSYFKQEYLGELPPP